MTIPPSNAATTAGMPAVRRPQQQPPHQATANLSAPSGPPAQAPAPPETEGGRGSILRFVVVVVLIALGAAFGIWLGQMMIA